MPETHRQTLLIAGALLFLVGLFSGVAVQAVHNPRMGLSAHLAGVQNALFLLAAGAVWRHIRLPLAASRLMVWLGILGMYGFWLALQLAAIWGTSRSTPIAGAGFEAGAWKEAIVSLSLKGASVAAIAAAALLLIGLWRGRK